MRTPVFRDGLPVDPDWWFHALDGQVVSGPRPWVAEVTAIIDGEQHMCVQLQPQAQPDRGLVLRLAKTATAEAALAANSPKNSCSNEPTSAASARRRLTFEAQWSPAARLGLCQPFARWVSDQKTKTTSLHKQFASARVASDGNIDDSIV